MYIEFEFHVTKHLAHGVSQLVSSAKKAMPSINRNCALLPISDPELRCKLSDSLPILSYDSEGMLMKRYVTLHSYCMDNSEAHTWCQGQYCKCHHTS